MNMLAVSLLLLPVAAAFALLYGPAVYASLNPGNEIMTASNYTFQSDTFSAAGAIGSYGEGYEVALALLAGGTLAAASHAAKAGGRVAINASPEPFSNWAASVAEDLLVLGGLILALFKPALFLTLLGAFLVGVVWLLPKLWRGLRRLFGGRRQAGDARSRLTPASVSFDCEAQRCELPISIAVPLGLVVNELVTNALKYAFSGRSEGHIRVSLVRDGGQVVLLVADDGVGMQGKVQGGGMGVPLLNGLAKSLKGKLEVDSGPRGTRAHLVFPLPAEVARMPIGARNHLH